MFVSANLIARVTARYGDPVIASLPVVTLDGDHAGAFEALRVQTGNAKVVLFPDIWPAGLDGFFRLRLAQILRGEAPQPGLSVVVLLPELAGSKLAGGFANRFHTAWPFERCVFITETGNPDELSRQLGLPVGAFNDFADTPVLLGTSVPPDQAIALQLQMPWGLCGSTTAFENQIEDLVGGGFLTIRLFTNSMARRGPTTDARMEKIVPENSLHAGAHIDALAVPDGPPGFLDTADALVDWATWMENTRSCVIRDPALTAAALSAAAVIANHIETVGPAIRLAPRAKLLLDVHDDRAASSTEWMRKEGKSEAEIEVNRIAAEYVQGIALSIPDVCTHVSTDELGRLAPHSQRSAIVLPRIYLTAKPAPAAPRFDVLLFGDEHTFNIAAIKWFLDDVWRVHLEPSGIRVALIGRAGLRLDQAAYQSPLLHILGFVDDLDTFRSWCRLTVVPDQAGTGIAVKMLTTLYAGHPVATTPIGLRGLDTAITGALPAFDDPADLAADILGLVRDQVRLEQRRVLVDQVATALRGGMNNLALLNTLAVPPADAAARREARWAGITACAMPAETEPYYFGLTTSFPMSGSKWDARVLCGGWHEPEPWGRWTDGAVASLRITLAEPAAEPLSLEIDIVPSAVAAILTVSVDSERFDSIQPVSGTNTWELPSGLTGGKTVFDVTLTAGETFCPALPGGSTDDRILGIGVNAVRLVSRQPFVFEPGQAVAIRAESMPRNVLLSGWHAPESWGCWSSGRTASFQLNTSAPLRGLVRLELDLTPSAAGGSLTMSVNDRRLPPRVLLSGINRWNLPADVTDGQTRLLIVLTVSETYCPAEHDPSGDDRVLGVGLRGIQVSALTPGILVPGVPLSLTPSVDLEDVLRDGWHEPEPWGTWTAAPVATMRLSPVRPLSGSFKLVLELATGLPVPMLTVTVNDHELAPAENPGDSAGWVLPPSCTDGRDELLITLAVPHLFCPATVSGSVDDRDLGAGVRSVLLERQSASTCAVGDLVVMSSRLGNNGMLAEGWHTLETWGCWSAGTEALLILPFTEPLDGTFVLQMNLMPPLQETDVTLVVNDSPCPPVRVIDGLNEWILPAESTDGQSVLTIKVCVAHPARPADVKGGSDDRLLGVGLRTVKLEPAAIVA